MTKRFLPVPFLLSLVLSACSALEPDPPLQAVHVVQQAKTTIDRFKGINTLKEFAVHLNDAKALVILPNVVKAGFIGAGEGGTGVLVKRTGANAWGYPAFYTLGAASVGFQAGVQSTEVVLILLNDKAVNAIIENQGKFGADAGLTVAVFGVGVEGSTTTNAGADILAFANARGGLFAGLSLEGAALIRRKDLNEAYYGAGATPQTIVLQGANRNPDADGLRASLAK